MRYLATLLLACLSHYCLAQAWQIAGDSQFEPYSYTQGHNMPAQGLDVELVEAILKEANIDYELRLYPWERVKLLLEESRIDMAFPFAGTPSRHQQYQLAGPLRSGSTVFMVSKSYRCMIGSSLATCSTTPSGKYAATRMHRITTAHH